MNLEGNLGAEVEDEEGNEDKEDQMGNKKNKSRHVQTK